MPQVDLGRCKGQVDLALRRLKRLQHKLGIARRLREVEFHEKAHFKET